MYQRPISDLIREKSEKTDVPKKISREEWKKEKELEEARKAGTAPALVDEHGKDINPHIPQYIATAPWYYGSATPTLKHQRNLNEKRKEPSSSSGLIQEYKRINSGKVATKFRPGACENCGAMGHNKKNCFERPRKTAAKFAKTNFAPDDVELKPLNLNYDGKRDIWNGFDSAMYKMVVDEFDKVTEAKKFLKEERMKKEMMKAKSKSKEGEEVNEEDKDTKDEEVEEDEDEDEKYAEKSDMPGTKVDSKQRITVRNLRIREDTAKYLRNLDLDSAYYDPKTRSMRDNPYKDSKKLPGELPYAGENFVRYTGDTVKVSNMQLFAWEAHEKGIDAHLQAEPTKTELLHKEYSVKKSEFKNKIKSSILEKYGGEEHLKSNQEILR